MSLADLYSMIGQGASYLSSVDWSAKFSSIWDTTQAAAQGLYSAGKTVYNSWQEASTEQQVAVGAAVIGLSLGVGAVGRYAYSNWISTGFDGSRATDAETAGRALEKSVRLSKVDDGGCHGGCSHGHAHSHAHAHSHSSPPQTTVIGATMLSPHVTVDPIKTSLKHDTDSHTRNHSVDDNDAQSGLTHHRNHVYAHGCGCSAHNTAGSEKSHNHAHDDVNAFDPTPDHNDGDNGHAEDDPQTPIEVSPTCVLPILDFILSLPTFWNHAFVDGPQSVFDLTAGDDNPSVESLVGNTSDRKQGECE